MMSCISLKGRQLEDMHYFIKYAGKAKTVVATDLLHLYTWCMLNTPKIFENLHLDCCQI